MNQNKCILLSKLCQIRNIESTYELDDDFFTFQFELSSEHKRFFYGLWNFLKNREIFSVNKVFIKDEKVYFGAYGGELLLDELICFFRHPIVPFTINADFFEVMVPILSQINDKHACFINGKGQKPFVLRSFLLDRVYREPIQDQLLDDWYEYGFSDFSQLQDYMYTVYSPFRESVLSKILSFFSL